MDLASSGRPVSSDAGQGDHGVAAPVGKPRVTGNQQTGIRLIEQRATHGKLRCGENQLTNPHGRLRGSVGPRGNPVFQMLFFNCGASVESGCGRQRGGGVGAQDKSDGLAGDAARAKNSREQMIFGVVEAAISFLG